MKTCSKCGETKDESDYHKHCQSKDGLRPDCKACCAAAGKAYRQRNAETIRRSNRRYVEANKETIKVKRAVYYRNNRHKKREYELLKRYGVSNEQFEVMERSQKGVCAICGEVRKDRLGRGLAVDHNHNTGKIRGLLCGQCNQGLGRFKDDPNLVLSAYNYLIQHGEQNEDLIESVA